jgi:tetratricopeptide (TPR) repeat protein
MKTLNRAAGWVAVFSCVLVACSTTPPTAETAQADLDIDAEGDVAPDPGLKAYQKSLQEIADLVQKEENAPKAHALLRERLAMPEFRRLPQYQQYVWLHLAGLLAMQLNDADVAHSVAVQSTIMPSAVEEDWLVRFYSAAVKDYRQDAVDSLTVIAQRWPEALEKYDDRYLASFIARVVRSPAPQTAQPLLEALFAAKWKMEGGLEPSYFWAQLARMLIEQKQPDRAKEVIARITAPRELLAMRVDKRFDPVVQADPKRFDVVAAVDRELVTLQKLSDASPRVLLLKAERVMAYIEAGRYSRAIAAADEVLAANATADAAAGHFDDAQEQFNWILDYRAQALQGLGKWAEAEQYMKTAAARPEEGRPNVSNTINLAFLYASLGRSDDAVTALGDLAKPIDNASEYGKMQVQLVLLRAAVAKKDAAAAQAALEALRAMQSASPETFQQALLDANQLEEAADLLISRLKNPQLRSAALVEVQEYKMPAPTPANRLTYERWGTLRARKDVQAAVAAVGRIEKFPLPPGMR